MKIADIELGEYPLFLAPMEDVTDPSFRYICKEFGADVMYTEFVSSDALIRDAKRALEKLLIYPYEFPIGIQIYGHLTEPMVEAAVMAASVNPSFIDINFGCPVNKIANRGAGSGMMRYPEKMVEITRRVVKAVKLPVTIKTRLGWDENSKIIVQLAEQLQDVGIAALTVHGRTRSQMYKGEADWSLIGEIKKNPRMSIPIIGNGDITSAEGAKRAFDTYGVDGIMIGRATYGKPWLFREIKHYLQTGEHLPDQTVNERADIAIRHLLKSVQVKGERVGVLEMRRHLSGYFKSLPNFKELRMKLVTEGDYREVIKLIEIIRERYGADEDKFSKFVSENFK